jgi:hypothetical protein
MQKNKYRSRRSMGSFSAFQISILIIFFICIYGQSHITADYPLLNIFIEFFLVLLPFSFFLPVPFEWIEIDQNARICRIKQFSNSHIYEISISDIQTINLGMSSKKWGPLLNWWAKQKIYFFTGSFPQKTLPGFSFSREAITQLKQINPNIRVDERIVL